MFSYRGIAFSNSQILRLLTMCHTIPLLFNKYLILDAPLKLQTFQFDAHMKFMLIRYSHQTDYFIYFFTDVGPQNVQIKFQLKQV